MRVYTQHTKRSWFFCCCLVLGLSTYACSDVQEEPLQQTPQWGPDGNMFCGTSMDGGSSWGSSPSGGNPTPQSKADFMQQVVQPQMQLMFQHSGLSQYQTTQLHCQSCHGRQEDEQLDFSKPSLLHPLDPKNIPTRKHQDPKIARIVAFMEDQVLPEMKRLLGDSTLTCFSCHGVKTERDMQGPPRLKDAWTQKTVDINKEVCTAQTIKRCTSSSSICYKGACLRQCIMGECAAGTTCRQAGDKKLCFPE